jgi:hypothetical protein
MKKEHEKKVCRVVAHMMCERNHIEIRGISYPDEEERTKKAVDVLIETSGQEIVLEHTQIESYYNQIQDCVRINDILLPVCEKLSEALPTPGHYEICINSGAANGIKNTQEIQSLIIKWAKEVAGSLEIGSPRTAPRHCIRKKPLDVPFEVTLYRWPDSDGKVYRKLYAPKELEQKREERIKQAFIDKCPKLQKAKGQNRLSILVLELNDISLGNHIYVSNVMYHEIHNRSDLSDYIYLVRTELNEWSVWILKEDEKLFQEIENHGPFYIEPNDYLKDKWLNS